MIDTTHIDEELVSIGAYLDKVRDTLAGGTMVDMAGLEKRIEGVCNDLLNVGHPAREKYLPQLAIMVERLDECERNLHKCYDISRQRGTPP